MEQHKAVKAQDSRKSMGCEDTQSQVQIPTSQLNIS